MYSIPAGIRFNDCVFSEPVRASEWVPPACGGIVALIAHDPHWSPRPYRPLYFGEFGNGAGRVVGTGEFLVSVFPMPYSTSAQRRAVCDDLVSGYNPIWQNRSAIGKLFTPPPAGPRRPMGFVA